MQITVETRETENFTYNIYHTVVKGRKFDIMHNATLGHWTVFAKGKGDSRPQYGKTFKDVKAVAQHYRTLRGFDQLVAA